MKQRFKHSKLVAVVAAFALAIPSIADEVPAAAQASILLKVLSYDRKLATRATGVVKIALVFRPGDPASEATRQSIGNAFDEAVAHFNVGGMAVKTAAVPFSAIAKLEADLVKEKATAVYLCEGLSDEIASIIKMTQSHSILSLSGSDAYVKSGASVAVARRGTRPAIVINLKSSRAEGADLDSSLLRLAEIVE
jgi:hypothetical protein